MLLVIDYWLFVKKRKKDKGKRLKAGCKINKFENLSFF